MSATHRFKGLQNGRYPPGDYEFLGIAYNVRTMQDEVVYRGCGGPDNGRWLAATLSDFARNFEAIEQEPESEPVIGKTMVITEGSGY